MNEPIFLALFIWTLIYLDDFLRNCFPNLDVPIRLARGSPSVALEACGITLAGGAFTRYDGWFVGSAIGVIVVFAVAVWWRRTTDIRQQRAMAKSLIEFLLLNALVPVFWLIYNNRVSGRALDFLNGPYSAKAIATRTTPHGAPPYPGQDHIFTAGLYFLESAKLNMGSTLLGPSAVHDGIGRNRRSCLAISQIRNLLVRCGLPLPFYALSIAYGSVPIFMPVLVPALVLQRAVRAGTVTCVCRVYRACGRSHFRANQRRECQGSDLVQWLAVAVSVGYLSAYRETPITLREAQVNSRDRVPLERALGSYLATLPHLAALLMYRVRPCRSPPAGGNSASLRYF